MRGCQYTVRMPELTANLLRVFHRRELSDSASGLLWYPKAQAIVRGWADTYGYSIATTASVIAAISPQCGWAQNLIIADDILAGRAPSIGGALLANVRKAQIIRDGRLSNTLATFPHGPKVASFAANLAGDDYRVTVDTHGAQAALDNVKATVWLKWTPYAVFAECYARAAKHLKIAPAHFQAIIWHVWKREHPPAVKRNRRRQWIVMGEY